MHIIGGKGKISMKCMHGFLMKSIKDIQFINKTPWEFSLKEKKNNSCSFAHYFLCYLDHLYLCKNTLKNIYYNSQITSMVPFKTAYIGCL